MTVNVASLPPLITSTSQQGNHYLATSVTQSSLSQARSNTEQIRAVVAASNLVGRFVDTIA